MWIFVNICEYSGIIGKLFPGGTDNLPLGNIAFTIMSFQIIAGRNDGVFWWFPALSEDQEKNSWIHQNYIVALTVSYNICKTQTKH